MTQSDKWLENQRSAIGGEIKRRRGGRSAQWLSDRTAELGYRVSRSTITDIEIKRRKYVTVSELTVLAEALDVAPVELLYPASEVAEYLPGRPMEPGQAIRQFGGWDSRDAQILAELAQLKRLRNRLNQHRTVEKATQSTNPLPDDLVARDEVEIRRRIAELTAMLSQSEGDADGG